MGWFRRNEHDEEQLSAYLDGELNARQTETVERHLVACESCAALLEELRSTRTLLSRLPAPEPRRSFVLGPEYARTPGRAPVRESRSGSPRLGLLMAPAMALSFLVALVFVDAANIPTSNDASDETAVTALRTEAGTEAAAEAGDDARSSAGAANLAPPSVAEDTAGTTAAAGTGPADSAGGGEAGSVPSAAMEPANTPPEPSPDGFERQTEQAAGAELAPLSQDGDAAPPSEEPLATRATDDDGGGVSTLRWLQIGAALAFLASALYVFVWPRLVGRGS